LAAEVRALTVTVVTRIATVTRIAVSVRATVFYIGKGTNI
jgi:hypothetical protein